MKNLYSRIARIALLILLPFFGFPQKYLPPNGKTLLVIGQDLGSVAQYANSGYFPTPSGITSYVNLYDVSSSTAAYAYGALGEKVDGTAAPDVDWGAGPLNTHNAAVGYPNSILSIGLYMTEDYYPNGLAKIANGDYDTQIIRLANFIKSKNKPVFVRIGYEFDGKWNTGYENTTNFKNAYKRIVDKIRPIAPNFVSVWQACTSPVDDILEGKHENIQDWYPGDDYVDWMGYSWFLTTPEQYSLTNEVIAYARARKKPVMVCESSPQGYDLNKLNYRYINTMLGGAPGTNPISKTPTQLWDEWFKPFFKYIHDNSDVVRAVAYINCNWDAQGKWGSPYNEGYWGDSRIEANAEMRSKWLAEINTSFWLHGSSTLFAQLTGNATTNQAPVVGFASPTDNQSFAKGSSLTVLVNATDDDTIKNVVLSLNGNTVGTKTAAPFQWSTESALKNLAVGTYTLKAAATDQHQHITTATITITVTDNTTPVTGRPYAPAAGKTLMLVGQTYTQEYKDYVNATKKAPAGSSHYGELYNGKINQGDDATNEAFLNYIETTYPLAYSELAISLKDNPAAGGYTGENAVWKACKDIPTGKWNTQIDALSASLKNRPTIKFLVRICYEVSLNMFANKTTTPFVDILNKYNNMGINPLEKADQVTEFDLTAYADAYNYIAKRIRETNQVNNVEFVFHPVRGFNDAKWLYPGDKYVDWFGISLFNHDVCYPTWEGTTPPFVNCPQTQAMDDNVQKCLTWAKNTIKKPIIIAESAVQAELAHQHNAAFMNGYIDKITNIIETYDVKAWVYINSNWVAKSWSSQWGDSRIETIADVKNHWLDKVSQSRYIHYPQIVASVEDESLFNGTKVYPNPTKDKVQITLSLSGEATVWIVNGFGQQVAKITSNDQDLQLDLSSLSSGLYHIVVNQMGKAKTFPVVKQ